MECIESSDVIQQLTGDGEGFQGYPFGPREYKQGDNGGGACGQNGSACVCKNMCPGNVCRFYD